MERGQCRNSHARACRVQDVGHTHGSTRKPKQGNVEEDVWLWEKGAGDDHRLGFSAG